MTTKTEPFEERISKFAMWQGQRFEIGFVSTVSKGIYRGGVGGEGEVEGGERERIGGREPVKLQHTHSI